MKYIRINKIKGAFISSLLDKHRAGLKNSPYIIIEGIRQISELIDFLIDNEIHAEYLMISDSYEEKLLNKREDENYKKILSYLNFCGIDTTYVIGQAICKKLSPTIKEPTIFLILNKDLLENRTGVNLENFLESLNIRNKNRDKRSIILYFEEIQDPGNLGTIIRSAKAFDISAILLGPNSTSIYQEKVMRASLSAVFALPIFENVSNTFIKAKKDYMTLISMDMKGINLEDFLTDYAKRISSNKVICLIFGNEGRGLSKEIKELSDYTVSIPMSGDMESLNVAISSAIAMYRFMDI